jgi:hypothetical protein
MRLAWTGLDPRMVEEEGKAEQTLDLAEGTTTLYSTTACSALLSYMVSGNSCFCMRFLFVFSDSSAYADVDTYG